MNKEYLFNFDNDLVKYVKKEVMKYLNEFNDNRVLYHYDRMTVNELTQEVLLKLFKSNQGKINKSYIRKNIMSVCIDSYRKNSDLDLDVIVGSSYRDNDDLTCLEDLFLSVDDDTLFESIYLESELKHFEGRELQIFLKALEGLKGQEIFQALNIPHRTYYTLLKKLKQRNI